MTLVGAGARLSRGLILAGSVLLRLAPGLWLRRSLFFAPVLGEPECGGAGLGELEPERLLLLVGAPGRRASMRSLGDTAREKRPKARCDERKSLGIIGAEV